ncbi:MAG: hypothetical protein HY000_19980 [Planctomycetes bacterium]|nr:hypothetical protein [Planctomycetota bacterium]
MSLPIEQVLQTVVARGASDLHLVVTQPPVIRLRGQLYRLGTEVLERDDVCVLVERIVPDHCRQELRERGKTAFGLAFDQKSRFHVTVFKQREHPSVVFHLER